MLRSLNGPTWLVAVFAGVLLVGCAEPADQSPTSAKPTATVAMTPAEVTTNTTAVETAPRSAEAIVNQYCAVCHARGLYNAPKIGDAVAWQAKLAEGRDHLWQVVLHGEKAMPPRGNCHDCSDAELRAAMDYLLGSAPPAESETEPKPETGVETVSKPEPATDPSR